MDQSTRRAVGHRLRSRQNLCWVRDCKKGYTTKVNHFIYKNVCNKAITLNDFLFCDINRQNDLSQIENDVISR